MIIGQQVRLIEYGDRIIDRVLVAVENQYIYVCKREEFEAAIQQNRQPICIGFRPEDLVEALN